MSASALGAVGVAPIIAYTYLCLVRDAGKGYKRRMPTEVDGFDVCSDPRSPCHIDRRDPMLRRPVDLAMQLRCLYAVRRTDSIQ
jgi:hypothetical protein